MSLVLRSLLPYPHSCQGTSPHQQGWDMKMAMLSFCGIDVSKDRLDVVVLPEGWFFSVSNDTAGWAELVVRLRPLTVSAIGLEPSGGYERGIIRALLAAGMSVRRINPNKLRQFARARGVLAFTLIALLPELGKMTRKQIAALVGLAPYDFDSGKLKGHRSIYGGRMPVRNVLYMAALSASRYSPALMAFHNRLADADKKSKVIIVAVMRKMITTLNAMLRDNTVWQPQSA